MTRSHIRSLQQVDVLDRPPAFDRRAVTAVTPARADISLAALAGPGKLGTLLRVVGPVIDRVLGIHDLARRYEDYGLGGLDKHAAAARILEQQGIEMPGAEQLRQAVPADGPALVVANHPYGGMEGIMLAHILGEHRRDVKILANVGLRVLTDLSGFFIFTNPLSPRSRGNVPSLLACRRHLQGGGLLVVFPAGQVSSHQEPLGRISDAPWNRLPAQLALQTGATVTSVFIAGENRKRFHRMGRVHPRFRLLMLVREMLALRDRAVPLACARPLPSGLLARLGDAQEVNDVLRLRVYLADPARDVTWPRVADQRAERFAPLAPPSDAAVVAREVAALSAAQRLVQHKGYSVYCGYQRQLPQTVREIARLREKTFRPVDEGSGESLDTDDFDATYLHLFLRRDGDGEILGAYRLGQTDVLIDGDDLSGMYLSAMFDFGPGFENRRAPCLELGRSFIVPEFQKSVHGLFLLWKGIGTYLVRNPRYRTLYGTVSLSKLYAPRTVDLIDRVLSSRTDDVAPVEPFSIPEHPDLNDYLRGRDLGMKQLSTLVQALEPDGKDLPVLVRQYANLGARFHCLGIDRSFADTPGLLLSIHVPGIPPRHLDRYLGPDKVAYLAHEGP